MHGLSFLRPRRTRKYLEHRCSYIDHPAVMKDDGSGPYRSLWKQGPWPEQEDPGEMQPFSQERAS
jgi:hypothetical protein